MSNQFSNPATYGDYKISSFSKEMKLDSFPNSILVAPFDGVVVPNKKRNCKNGISIKHNFNNEVLYSNFCDVGVSFISVGDYVRQNTTIGQFGSEQIIYSVENANGDKININDLMKGATVRKSEERTTRPVKSNQIKKRKNKKIMKVRQILLWIYYFHHYRLLKMYLEKNLSKKSWNVSKN